MKLLIATKNKHKLAEIRSIFTFPGIELSDLESFPNAPDVIEDGETFDANARKKAVELARLTGLWTLADDSGLEVDALGGAPGVLSARYAGEPVSYPANNRKLLDALRNVSNRRARFRCVIALSDPKGDCRTVEGRCEGRIIDEEKGSGGFGYDPLFIPDGFSMTFSEMPQDKKNEISHRAWALKKAYAEWAQIFRLNQGDEKKDEPTSLQAATKVERMKFEG